MQMCQLQLAACCPGIVGGGSDGAALICQALGPIYPTCITQAGATQLFLLKSAVKFSSTLTTLNQDPWMALSRNMINGFPSASQRWVENTSWKAAW